ncbi:MAG: hypothetical protein H6969_12195, partial [Gammaproteobacteria bacterium]|nr:hypothetical protein [Gammaproteobacteria bacterium]
VGRLEAPAADSFIREFLQGWQTGRTVSDLLWDAQRHSESDFGARQFRLVGQAQLHQGPACAVFDLPDEALAEKALDDGQALLILLERITRRTYRNDGNLESVVDNLYEGLHVQYDERDAESKLLKKLDAVHEQLRPLTARWVVPFIVYLAEVYDHTLLPKYEALRVAQAQDVEENAPPYIFHYWGKLYYRQGHYGQALDEVIKGIERVGDQRICAPAGVGLLGLLVNCLIDLNVPNFGLMLYDRLDACLSQAGDRLSQLQKINRLDRRARLALRLGAPEQAMMYLQRKHEIDHRDPARELAGLLYASAWGFENLGAEARKYALEAGALLRQHDNPLSQLGRGNETLAYLLRAYALWAWRAKDREAFDWLVKALEPVQRRLTFHDPGPLGFTMAFLHLYRQEHAIEASGLLRWEVAESALEPFEYWLELAIFSCLLNRPQQANRFLGRFQQMRLETNNAVRRLPSWLIFDQHTSWQKEMEDRDALERKLLLGDAPPAVVDMVRVGLIAL